MHLSGGSSGELKHLHCSSQPASLGPGGLQEDMMAVIE